MYVVLHVMEEVKLCKLHNTVYSFRVRFEIMCTHLTDRVLNLNQLPFEMLLLDFDVKS